LGLKNSTFFLAITLFAAAPVFADGAIDKAPVASMDGDRSDSSRQGMPHKNALHGAATSRNFFPGSVKLSEARIDLGPAISSRGFSERTEGSDLDGPRNGEPVSNIRPVSVFDVDTKHGGSSGLNDHKDLDDGNGSLSVIAVPEPGSGTLSLFGFAILGMIAYGRKTLRNAI
jgi:PEP-CTERM motif